MSAAQPPVEKVRLADKLGRIARHWDPKIVGELNGQHVKLAKLLGSFVWHRHETQDELFLVLEGTLEMQFRGLSVRVSAGELLIVPRGVEHRPVAAEEVHVLLVEPAGTRNTGDVVCELTVEEPERL